MRRTVVLGVLTIATASQLAHAAEPRLLSDSSQVARADRAVVFVHGLFGAPGESFGNWPKIITNDHTALPGHGRLSDFAVYAVDYEADFKSNAKMDDVAIGVSRELAASQIFKHHRHVWLVAHSMGGLVLKRAMARWLLEKRELLIDRIMGIGMLGVPSAGAPLADLAKRRGVDAIATTFGWNGELLKDLTTNGGSYLDALESDWMAVKRWRETHEPRRFTPLISCGFETKPEVDRGFWWNLGVKVLGGLLKEDIDTTVVPKLFTSSACDERRSFSVKHTALIKPTSAADSQHLWLRELIANSIVGGIQEQRAVVMTSPPSVSLSPSGAVNFNVAGKVDFMNQELAPERLDRATGLPLAPERIEFDDDKSRRLAMRLVLRGGPFHGSTKLDAWEAAAKKNTCLQVGHSLNRMTITLSIKGGTTSCAGGALICVGQSCN